MFSAKKIGELTIKMETLERGTTKPLIHDIEILYPNRLKTEKRYIGIVDTGADITMIDPELIEKLHLKKIGDHFHELRIRIPILFEKEILCFEIQSFNITNNNKADLKPDILLGRDFLSRCKLSYNGLDNTVLIESYEVQ